MFSWLIGNIFQTVVANKITKLVTKEDYDKYKQQQHNLLPASIKVPFWKAMYHVSSFFLVTKEKNLK